MRNPLLLMTALAALSATAETRVYLGTGGGSSSKGIYVASFDPATGALGVPRLAVEAKNPTFLGLHPDGRHLYAVGEVGEGAVSSFEIQADGMLTRLNYRGTGGGGPCFVGLDPAGKVALAANYGGGSIASFPILPDGTLGERASFFQHTGSSVNPNRQKEPHAHSINASPDGRFAFAADLGLDKILIHHLDTATGVLTPNDPAFVDLAPGSGPRHFCFHPNGKTAYVINEMLCTITSFAYDAAKGTLTTLGTVSTLPAGVKRVDAYSTSEIVAHPNGKSIYGANRGHDSITAFAVQSDGTLTLEQNIPCGGKVPRNFNIDPSGRWLLVANQGSDNVSVLKLDPATGRLDSAGPGIALGKPMCVKFWLGK